MKIINEKDFEKETKEGFVLIDFFATWCGPCRMMSMVLDEVENDMDKVKFVKIDVDESEKLARKFGVMSIPTLVLLKDGEEVFKSIGFLQKDKLIELIEKHI